MMICSKRRTGKTIYLKDLLSRIYKNYKKCYVFSGTVDYQKEPYDYIDDQHKINGYSESKLEEIWSQQEMYIKQSLLAKPKNMSESDYKNTLDHVLLIFDDIIDEEGFKGSKIFNRLFTKSRHLCFCTIAISQYYSSLGGISATARKNTDFITAFFLDCYSDQEHLVNDFMSKNSKQEGLQLYQDITNVPYQCIILCNHKTTRHYNEYVYKYIANPKPKKFFFKSDSLNSNALSKNSSSIDIVNPLYLLAFNVLNSNKESDDANNKKNRRKVY